MSRFRLLLWCLTVFGCTVALAMNPGVKGKSGGLSPGTRSIQAGVDYALQLMPGQQFTGYWYFWTNSHPLSGALHDTPAVPWLTLGNARFTTDSCTDIKAILLNFQAPTDTGLFKTFIVDSLARWDTINVMLTVTNTPDVSESVPLSLSSATPIMRPDTVDWFGFGEFSCVSNFVPDSTITVNYAINPPAAWISIQPESLLVPFDSSRVVQRTFTGPVSGTQTAYEIRTFQSSSYPRFIQYVAVGPTSVDGPSSSQAPHAYALEQNYPNPFNPETGVRFQVSGESDVKLVVYDMLGREVAVLVNERKAAGTYTVRFDGTGLASGVYVYRLAAGSFVQSRTMVLLK